MLTHKCRAVPMPCSAVALRSRFQSGMTGARQGRGVVCLLALVGTTIRLQYSVSLEADSFGHHD
jgi:hypothetical protein